jgi:hypothetical protein
MKETSPLSLVDRSACGLFDPNFQQQSSPKLTKHKNSLSFRHKSTLRCHRYRFRSLKSLSALVAANIRRKTNCLNSQNAGMIHFFTICHRRLIVFAQDDAPHESAPFV